MIRGRESSQVVFALQILQNVYRLHKKDPNFPLVIINKIEEFLGTLRSSTPA